MRIAVGCDHRGLDIKKQVIDMVRQSGHTIEDMGTYNTDSVDYPDIAGKVAAAVSRADFDRGILICDTGIGMSIAANKVKGIRAALCHNAFTARRARLHNDANVLCIGAHEAESIPETVQSFLSTEFEGGRHQRRLDKIKAMEG